jgi:hypothetical protein
MATFEYDVIHVKGSRTGPATLDVANDRGAEGWEAFAATEDNTGWWLFLRRPTEGIAAAGQKTPPSRAGRPRR